MEKAVFLDRDGVIIEDAGYIGEIDRVRFINGVGKAINLLNKNGFRVIVITNQAGVARGYFDEGTVKEINRYVQESLAREGALIDMFYYCPHHVDGVVEAYRKDCYCRKPNPGMIEKAVRDFGIDLRKSFVIGDKSLDIEVGRRTGCRTILIAEEASRNSQGDSDVIPDYVAPDLYQAVRWLVKHSRREG